MSHKRINDVENNIFYLRFTVISLFVVPTIIYVNKIKNKKERKVNAQCTFPYVLPTFSEIKLQKLSLGQYLFKRYMFVPKESFLVP